MSGGRRGGAGAALEDVAPELPAAFRMGSGDRRASSAASFMLDTVGGVDYKRYILYRIDILMMGAAQMRRAGPRTSSRPCCSRAENGGASFPDCP